MTDDVNKTEDKQNEYEDICYICRRPESKAGTMMKIPNGICICADCMQKTFNAMNNNPFPMGGIDLTGFSPFMFGGEMPKSQKLKKKQPKEQPNKAADNVPDSTLT